MPSGRQGICFTHLVLQLVVMRFLLQIFPMTGGNFAHTFQNKPRFRNFFHVAFVSARYAHLLKEDCFRDILVRPTRTERVASGDGSVVEQVGAVVAVETAKFLVNLNKDLKQEFVNKIDEYCQGSGLTRMVQPPVFRRRRDEQDTEDDVVFYTTKA